MAWGQEKGADFHISALRACQYEIFDFVPCSLPLKTLILLTFSCFLIRRRGKRSSFLFFQKRRCRFWRRFALRCMHAPKARTLRSVRSVNRHAAVAAIYDFNFSVPAGTEFCEAAVKWKSVADFYPQGVRGIRKAAKLPTAAQDCRARRQIMLNLFWRDRK